MTSRRNITALTSTQSGLLVAVTVLYKYHYIKTNIRIFEVPSHDIIDALPRNAQEQKDRPHVPSCSRIIQLLPRDISSQPYMVKVSREH